MVTHAMAQVMARAAPVDLVALTKPRITLLVMLTVAAGYVLGIPVTRGAWGAREWMLLVHTVLGAGLVASGASALNQVAERDIDALMRRTARRPLPAGRLTVRDATAFGWMLCIVGVTYLSLAVNVTTAIVAAATFGSYLLLYTPLKRRTPVATIIGVVPGALPIVGGWSGAGAPLDARVWVLFAMLCLWQVPHFLALAWMFREDYGRAGLRMLSVVEPDGDSTFRQSVYTAAALIPISLAPAMLGMSGGVYFIGAAALS
ncbi:MAG TPA: heme o synthase, partial [Gemmatimonadales bacterium]|nr:heme o synthase [Gemmatimonadales bacterium]